MLKGARPASRNAVRGAIGGCFVGRPGDQGVAPESYAHHSEGSRTHTLASGLLGHGRAVYNDGPIR